MISKVANVIQLCGEEQLMGHLGVVLYEYLGEEYPEVLGSILGALKVKLFYFYFVFDRFFFFVSFFSLLKSHFVLRDFGAVTLHFVGIWTPKNNCDV